MFYHHVCRDFTVIKLLVVYLHMKSSPLYFKSLWCPSISQLNPNYDVLSVANSMNQFQKIPKKSQLHPVSSNYMQTTIDATTGTSIEISIGAISEDAAESSQARIVKTSRKNAVAGPNDASEKHLDNNWDLKLKTEKYGKMKIGNSESEEQMS